MAERHKGFPGKTALLEQESQRARSKHDPPANASASSMELALDKDIGKLIAQRYEITGVIGEGGMGVVYQAYDNQIQRRVAIKLVRRESTTDRKFITRFRRELEITTQLRHPSTIRVFEHGETEDGRPYMVMELLTGESLGDRLERGRLPELEALQYARQVAESLSEAHANGIFHRDLKPDNIFIETVGVSTVVKVLDFGIAGGVDASRLTQAGEVFGTPQYMSPEQCNGATLDHRTDIYSLGCILYEMIEGRPPFSSDSPMATMLKHVRSKVPPPRHCSRETAKALYMALRKDRNRRVQSAGEFAELIGRCIGAYRARQEGRSPDDTSGMRPMPTGPTVSVSTDSTSTTGLPVGTASEGHGKTIAIVLGAAFLLLVGLMVFGDFDWQSTAPADGATEAADAAARETTPKTSIGGDNFPLNRAFITTNVKGATVLVDGTVQCKTPCEIKVPVADGKTHEIRIKKPGYTDVVANWQPASVSEAPPPLPDLKPL